ncbi:MAG: methyltransferase [Burkholderiaceae bacterium]|nr:methyltransferase [Burkholderiaceae bacterium]
MSSASLQRQLFAAKAFALVQRLADGLARWTQGLVPPPFRLLQIGSAFWQSRALYVAARLDLATRLGDAALPVPALAAQVGADARALQRLLRLLAAMGVFEEREVGVYANNRLSAPLRDDHPHSVRAMVLMHNSPEMSRPWYEQLEPAVRSGATPFRLTHGRDLYQHMDAHPDFEALFGQAMAQVEAVTGDSFATAMDWGRFRRVIDVGGSRGAKSVSLLKRHPQLQALVVDRARAIEGAPAQWAQDAAAAALLPRLSFEAGDLLTGPLPAARPGDVYLLCAVLHGFADALVVQALRRLAEVAGTQAPIMLLELVMPDTRADLAHAAFDLQMFMGTEGGERTLAEWQSLFLRSGLELREQVLLSGFGRLLVLHSAG